MDAGNRLVKNLVDGSALGKRKFDGMEDLIRKMCGVRFSLIRKTRAISIALFQKIITKTIFDLTTV